MPGYLDSRSNITFGYDDGEDTWGTPTNRSLRQLAYVGLHPSVKNSTTSTPPASPTLGDKYIVASNPTGLWATYNENDIAVWGRGITSPATLAWQRFIPLKGFVIYNEDTDLQLKYNGNSWVTSIGVQSDYNETDVNDPAFIKNKPNISALSPLAGSQSFDFSATANLVHTETIATINLNEAQIATMQLSDTVRLGTAVRMEYRNANTTTTTKLFFTVSFAETRRTSDIGTRSNPISTSAYPPGDHNLLRTGGALLQTSRLTNTITAMAIKLQTTATISDDFECEGTVYYGLYSGSSIN